MGEFKVGIVHGHQIVPWGFGLSLQALWDLSHAIEIPKAQDSTEQTSFHFRVDFFNIEATTIPL